MIQTIIRRMGKTTRTKKWKYIYYPNGNEELYNLEYDLDENENLSDDTKYSKAKYIMKEKILDWSITASETIQIAEKWLV